MLTIYNLIFFFATMIASPVLLYLAIVRGHSLKERLGIQDREVLSRLGDSPRVWFHAASMGEVKVLAALLPHFRSQFRGYRILISTTTKTGKAQAQRLIPFADLFTYLPLDLRWCVNKALRTLKPEALVIVETEFWPNLISLAKRRGIRVFLINGRISSRSFGKYQKFKFLFAPVLSRIDSLLMQTDTDRERIIAIGAPGQRVKVLGNTKLDYLSLKDGLINGDKRDFLSRQLAGRRLLVAGSTRRGEEETVLQAFREVRSRFQDSLLLLAPRHLSRQKEVESLLKRGCWNFVRRSELYPLGGDNSLDVMILDTMGELLTFYSLAAVAFVGGSLVPVGGHDPLEPAAFAVPVLFGPYMQNAAPWPDLLLKSGGAFQVKGERELGQRIVELLGDEEKRRRMGRSAQKVIDENTGTCLKIITNLKHQLSPKQELGC